MRFHLDSTLLVGPKTGLTVRNAISQPISAAFSFSLVALVGVPRSYWQVSLIMASALSKTPTQHEAVIGTVNRASMSELRRRRVHSSEPSSACARPDRPSRF